MLNRRISDTIGNDYLDAVQRFLFGWAVVPGSGVTISPMSWSMLLSNPPSLPPLGITFLALGLRFVPGGVSRLGSGNTLSGLPIVVLPIPLLNLPVLSWHVSVGLRPLKTCLLMRWLRCVGGWLNARLRCGQLRITKDLLARGIQYGLHASKSSLGMITLIGSATLNNIENDPFQRKKQVPK